MRPTFDLQLRATTPAVLEALRRALEAADAPVAGVVGRKAADLWMPPGVEHYWSPTLTLSFDGDDDKAQLHGRFGPRASVWTMFMAIYGLIAMAGVAASMWGVSQWMMQREPWALLGVPASVALFGFVYGAVFIGQGLGAAQMYTLHSFVDRVLEASAEPQSEVNP